MTPTERLHATVVDLVGEHFEYEVDSDSDEAHREVIDGLHAALLSTFGLDR